LYVHAHCLSVGPAYHCVRRTRSLRLSYLLYYNLQLGTCAMKPREQGGVVDHRLNVYGTQNLKVAGMFSR
jgi:hypothetical protein